MSYNFFQNALDAGRVTPQVQPTYIPSVIKDQSLYNTQNLVQSSITDEEKEYLKSQGFSDDEIIQAESQMKQDPTTEQSQEKGFFE